MNLKKLHLSVTERNKKIKERGKKKYVLRLLTTSLLQCLALTVLAKIIDSKQLIITIDYHLIIKFIILFIILSLINLSIGLKYTWHRL